MTTHINRDTLINRDKRIGYRMAGVAVVIDDDGLPTRKPFRVWSDNLSRSGVMLFSDELLPIGEHILFWMRTPEFCQMLADCVIVRRELYEAEILDRSLPRHRYGLRTLTFRTEEEVDPKILGMLKACPTEDPPPEEEQTTNDVEASATPSAAVSALENRESLVPFLSACGLIVVHLSRLACC